MIVRQVKKTPNFKVNRNKIPIPGSCILCNTPTADSLCSAGTTNCAIKQDSSGKRLIYYQ